MNYSLTVALLRCLGMYFETFWSFTLVSVALLLVAFFVFGYLK
jgi:hypothetical protein